MRQSLSVFSVCLLTVMLRAALPSLATAADDEKALQGAWTAVTAELGGRPFSDAELGTVTLTIEGERYTVLVNGKPDQGTCKTDASAKPGKMTITGGEGGPNAGKMFLAIYELDGDRLRICYDLSGKKSPEAFATQKGTPLYLVTYQRKK